MPMNVWGQHPLRGIGSSCGKAPPDILKTLTKQLSLDSADPTGPRSDSGDTVSGSGNPSTGHRAEGLLAKADFCGLVERFSLVANAHLNQVILGCFSRASGQKQLQ